MGSIIEHVIAAAEHEAATSGLPGLWEGPADAMRHIVGAAELRRRLGLVAALAVLEGNEVLGARAGYGRASIRMDRRNNFVGLEIGADARTFDEVVVRSRAAAMIAIAREDSGADGTAMWQQRSAWRDVPSLGTSARDRPLSLAEHIPGTNPYAFGGADHAFLAGPTLRDIEARRLTDLALVPPEHWSEADARAVIRSRPYRDSRDPGRETWQRRVRAYFEAKTARDADDAMSERDGETCTGSTAVRAHTRAGPNGRPVQVGAHQRAVACP